MLLHALLWQPSICALSFPFTSSSSSASPLSPSNSLGHAILFAAMPLLPHHEIEIKLPVRDVPSLLKLLQQLRASSRGRVFEQNTLYDTRASSLRRFGRLLRI